MRGVWIAAVFAVALAACGQQQTAVDREESVASAPMGMAGGIARGRAEAPAAEAAADAVAPAAPTPPPMAGEATRTPPPGPQTQAGQAAPVSYLAYSYQMQIEAPGAEITTLVERQAAACRAAGPRFCQLVGSSVSGDPNSDISAQLNIRGEPTWLRGFMEGIGTSVRAADGRIRAQSTNTEDLTRSIIDTEAQLRARRTLRDRLQGLLASRPGRLSDLLEVERELARVQAEIDSTESNLAAMRTRVDMSELSVSYQSSQRPVASDTFEPLGAAFANFIGYIVQGVAAIVTVIAILLPWALIVWLIAWVALRIRRARGGRFIRRTDTPPSNEPSP